MLKNNKIFLVIAAVFLIVSFLSGEHEILDGLCKAMCGVFAIVFFIVQFFGDGSDVEQSHHGTVAPGLRKH